MIQKKGINVSFVMLVILGEFLLETITRVFVTLSKDYKRPDLMDTLFTG